MNYAQYGERDVRCEACSSYDNVRFWHGGCAWICSACDLHSWTSGGEKHAWEKALKDQIARRRKRASFPFASIPMPLDPGPRRHEDICGCGDCILVDMYLDTRERIFQARSSAWFKR